MLDQLEHPGFGKDHWPFKRHLTVISSSPLSALNPGSHVTAAVEPGPVPEKATDPPVTVKALHAGAIMIKKMPLKLREK